nr:10087_t:CDS:2 [Entrophospora candida]
MGPYTIIAVISTTAYKLDLPENLKIHPLVRTKPHYLVKWKGYPLHDATWEPTEHLKNAEKKVKEFELMRMSELKEGRM